MLREGRPLLQPRREEGEPPLSRSSHEVLMDTSARSCAVRPRRLIETAALGSPRRPLRHALTRGNLRQVVEVLKVLKQISRHGNAGGVVLSKCDFFLKKEKTNK